MATANPKLIQSCYGIYVSLFYISMKCEECSINIILDVLDVLSFSAFYRLNVSYIASYHINGRYPILLKTFLWIPEYVLGQNHFDLGHKTMNWCEFSNIRLSHSHLGRHLESYYNSANFGLSEIIIRFPRKPFAL